MSRTIIFKLLYLGHANPICRRRFGKSGSRVLSHKTKDQQLLLA